MKLLDKNDDFRLTTAYGETFPDLTQKKSVDSLIDKINDLIEINDLLVKYINTENQKL